MATQTKGNTLRLYLRDDELELLQKLTEVLEIPQTEIMSRIMTAGIRAIRDAGNRMPLPLRFGILEALPEESKPSNKARR
jgi:hypothetical protein